MRRGANQQPSEGDGSADGLCDGVGVWWDDDRRALEAEEGLVEHRGQKRGRCSSEHGPTRVADSGGDGGGVERREASKIDHVDLDALGAQDVGGTTRCPDSGTPTQERGVVACAED